MDTCSDADTIQAASTMTKLPAVALAVVLATCHVSAHGPREHPRSQFLIQNFQVQLDPSITISIDDATAFTQQKQQVTVSWSGLQDPNEHDMLAVYINSVNPYRTLPVQYVSCAAADPAHMEGGSGSATVTLLNMRGDFKFALLRGGVVHPKLVAQSNNLPNKIRAHPTGAHLALHADERSVVVQWISSSPYPQSIQWGKAVGSRSSSSSHGAGAVSSYRFMGTSTPVTYTAKDMCGYPANGSGWLHPGRIHSAVLPAHTLEPGQRYVYRFGGDGGAGWSKEFSFLAPMGPGGTHATQTSDIMHNRLTVGRSTHVNDEKSQLVSCQAVEDEQGEVPFTFLAFNDVAMAGPLLFNNPGRGLNFADHYGENSTYLSKQLLKEPDAQLALMVGDLAYAMGYSCEWDVFGEQFQDAFTQWPMAVGTGNHERDWPGTEDAFGGTARDSGGECNVPFMHRWYTPANVKGDPRTSYYAFRQGPVHFLILDSETPSDPDSPQGRFVAETLASVDRSVTPWVVVSMHRMMVAPATWHRAYVGDMEVMERLQHDYEDLFRQYKVDVVVQGHEHAYGRTCPMYHDQCTISDTDPAASQPSSIYTAPPPFGQVQHAMTKACFQGSSGDGSTAQGRKQHSSSGSCKDGELVTGRPQGLIRHTFKAQSGGPVYVLAGHAGAGFTWGFPRVLPDWVETGAQGVNGYLRFKVTPHTLRMEAVKSRDGTVMDHMDLVA